MTLIVDANVAIKWFVEERDSPAALAILTRGGRILAPDVLIPEIANVLWLKARTGHVAPEQCRSVIAQLARMIDRFVPSGELAGRAMEMAMAIDHPAYDCFYLALAQRENAPLVTADRRLLERISATPFANLALPLVG